MDGEFYAYANGYWIYIKGFRAGKYSTADERSKEMAVKRLKMYFNNSKRVKHTTLVAEKLKSDV